MNTTTPLADSIKYIGLFVGLLWAIHLVTVLADLDLRYYGVVPRSAENLGGVLSAPLIHGSWQHLISNTPPLLFLGAMLFYAYPRSRFWAFAGIWLLSGMGVWLFARSSYHFGASGLTHGLFFYLFVAGIIRRDRQSAVLLMIAFYLYGGMIFTILPGKPDVSFESHLFGALAGGVLAYALRNMDPKAKAMYFLRAKDEKPDQALEDEDPLIGDQWRTVEEAEEEKTQDPRTLQ